MSSILRNTLRSNLPTSINKSIQRSISTTPTTMSIFRPFFNDPFFSSPFQIGLSPVAHQEARQRGLENPLENFFKPSGLNLNGPAMDLHEESNRYLLTAEVPGVKKEDVQISVDDRLHKLTISGSTKREITSGGDDTQTQTPAQATSDNQNGKSDEAGTQVAKSNQSSEVTSTKNNRPLVSERVFGSFSRSFTFPDQADLTKIKARFQDGLLKLEIPKVEVEKPKVRTVTIEDVKE